MQISSTVVSNWHRLWNQVIRNCTEVSPFTLREVGIRFQCPTLHAALETIHSLQFATVWTVLTTGSFWTCIHRRVGCNVCPATVAQRCLCANSFFHRTVQLECEVLIETRILNETGNVFFLSKSAQTKCEKRSQCKSKNLFHAEIN